MRPTFPDATNLRPGAVGFQVLYRSVLAVLATGSVIGLLALWVAG